MKKKTSLAITLTDIENTKEFYESGHSDSSTMVSQTYAPNIGTIAFTHTNNDVSSIDEEMLLEKVTKVIETYYERKVTDIQIKNGYKLREVIATEIDAVFGGTSPIYLLVALDNEYEATIEVQQTWIS